MINSIATRFRGFLPVVVDIESGGINPSQDALLELAAITIKMDEEGFIHPDQVYHYHVQSFEGAHIDPKALAFNKIDPGHPFRFAIPEKDALKELFKNIDKECKLKGCKRAVLVGHNAWFDQHFLNAAVVRSGLTKKTPFHRFTSLDTATLSGLAYGHTVLSKALELAGIPFKSDEAHSALYDTECTAQLFCTIVNRWKTLGGWPLF